MATLNAVAYAAYDDRALRLLDNEHRAAVDSIWSDTTLKPLLQRLLEVNTPWKFAPVVHLAYPSATFGRCYGLNRFLTHLLVRYHNERWTPPPSLLWPRTKVQTVTCAGHRAGDPRVCFGKVHRITWETGGVVSPAPTAYDVVLVRTGVELPVRVTRDGRHVPVPRLILPFHINEIPLTHLTAAVP